MHLSNAERGTLPFMAADKSPMPGWPRHQEWEARKSASDCPICQSGRPFNVLVEFAASFACAGPTGPLPGYVCMVARRHVVEPFELPELESGQFWAESMLVARALHRLFNPVKINYEIHGNTMPHLHLHLYPRFAGDPYIGGQIAWTASFDRSATELEAIADAIKRERDVL